MSDYMDRAVEAAAGPTAYPWRKAQVRELLEKAEPLIAEHARQEATKEAEEWWEPTTAYWHERTQELQRQMAAENRLHDLNVADARQEERSKVESAEKALAEIARDGFDLPLEWRGDPVGYYTSLARTALLEMGATLQATTQGEGEAPAPYSRGDRICTHCGRLDGKAHLLTCPFAKEERQPIQDGQSSPGEGSDDA